MKGTGAGCWAEGLTTWDDWVCGPGGRPLRVDGGRGVGGGQGLTGGSRAGGRGAAEDKSVGMWAVKGGTRERSEGEEEE